MTPPENVLSPRSEGTAWIVELEQADHRLPKPHTHAHLQRGGQPRTSARLGWAQIVRDDEHRFTHDVTGLFLAVATGLRLYRIRTSHLRTSAIVCNVAIGKDPLTAALAGLV